MKSRFSQIILSVLILSLALQTITLPALAQSEPNQSQAEIKNQPDFQEREQPAYQNHRFAQLYLKDLCENMPPELPERHQRHSETSQRPDAIPPSPEIIAKTKAQVASFDCASVEDVSETECEALVDFYESTYGTEWTNNTNWLKTTTIGNWYGVTVADGAVKELTIHNNYLNGVIPRAIGNLSNLQVLSLAFNQLTGKIPSSLGNLSELEYLGLTSNQLKGSIPAELGNLSKLESLYLYSNQLNGSIPSSLGNLSGLHYLYLDRNQLTGSVPPALGDLDNLRIFTLYNNQLTGRIPLSFVGLTSLDYFLFYGTNLCEPATDEFLIWKDSVSYWDGTGVICAEENLICLPLIFR